MREKYSTALQCSVPVIGYESHRDTMSIDERNGKHCKTVVEPISKLSGEDIQGYYQMLRELRVPKEDAKVARSLMQNEGTFVFKNEERKVSVSTIKDTVGHLGEIVGRRRLQPQPVPIFESARR